MMWPDCSPPSVQPRRSSSVGDVLVADRCRRDLDPGVRHRLMKADSCSSRSPPRHRRAGPRRARCRGTQGDQLVAVANPAVAVHRDHAVAVAVEGESDLGIAVRHSRREALGMRRAAALVDVPPVRLDGDSSARRPRAARRPSAPRDRSRRWRSRAPPAARRGRAGTSRAGPAGSRPRRPRACAPGPPPAVGEPDPRPGPRSRPRASRRSSARPAPKNLIPLCCQGLCEAETTAARSRP